MELILIFTEWEVTIMKQCHNFKIKNTINYNNLIHGTIIKI